MLGNKSIEETQKALLRTTKQGYNAIAGAEWAIAWLKYLCDKIEAIDRWATFHDVCLKVSPYYYSIPVLLYVPYHKSYYGVCTEAIRWVKQAFPSATETKYNFVWNETVDREKLILAEGDTMDSALYGTLPIKFRGVIDKYNNECDERGAPLRVNPNTMVAVRRFFNADNPPEELTKGGQCGWRRVERPPMPAETDTVWMCDTT